MAGKMESSAIQTDREDLLAIVELRFGEVPSVVCQRIQSIERREMLERMIVIAANATTFETFLEELFEGKESFRIVGEQFNPAL
jgi:hypothetical protein